VVVVVRVEARVGEKVNTSTREIPREKKKKAQYLEEFSILAGQPAGFFDDAAGDTHAVQDRHVQYDRLCAVVHRLSAPASRLSEQSIRINVQKE
jgi:hypothetical protein